MYRAKLRGFPKDKRYVFTWSTVSTFHAVPFRQIDLYATLPPGTKFLDYLNSVPYRGVRGSNEKDGDERTRWLLWLKGGRRADDNTSGALCSRIFGKFLELWGKRPAKSGPCVARENFIQFPKVTSSRRTSQFLADGVFDALRQNGSGISSLNKRDTTARLIAIRSMTLLLYFYLRMEPKEEAKKEYILFSKCV